MEKLMESLRLKEMLGYMGYGKILAYISLGAMIVTYIIHKIFKLKRWVKYIPGLLMIIFSLYNLTQLDISANNFLKDNSLIYLVLGLTGGMSTLLFALILGVFNKPKKVKEARRKDLSNTTN